MKYEIHPANGGKHMMEKVFDLGFFKGLSSLVFKVILHYWNFFSSFSRTKGFNICVLWGLCWDFFCCGCCFIFALICILNIRDQFSCALWVLVWFLTLCCHFCAFKVGKKCYQNRTAVFHVSFAPGSEGINLNIEYIASYSSSLTRILFFFNGN